MGIQCQVVGFESAQRVMTSVSPEVTICLRGRHAVGKSEAVYQAASQLRADFYRDPENCTKMMKALGGRVRTVIDGQKAWVTEWNYELGLPVVERRLSQMTEGDIIGLPEMVEISDGESSWNSTAFRPCDWLIQACQFPVMLFLDERNRALQGVKQAVFQLADSKVFYGAVLHSESRIVVAENVGEAYQVEQSDPAEVSRWVTFELEPSVDEWLTWAADHCHPATIEFVRQNPKALEHKGTYEPDKKYPDRRAWFKLDQECQRLGLLDSDDTTFLYVLAGGFLGPEWGSRFTKFVAEREKEVSAKDILADWEAAKRRLGKGQKDGVMAEQYTECVAKLADWLKEHALSESEAKQFACFMYDAPAEACMTAWATLQKNVANLTRVHPYIQQLMVARATGDNTVEVQHPMDISPTPSPESNTPTPKQRKRGRRKK